MVFESLTPNLKYEAAVRARPSAASRSKGVWSEWSEPVLWRTPAARKHQSQAVRLGGEGKQCSRAKAGC